MNMCQIGPKPKWWESIVLWWERKTLPTSRKYDSRYQIPDAELSEWYDTGGNTALGDRTWKTPENGAWITVMEMSLNDRITGRYRSGELCNLNEGPFNVHRIFALWRFAKPEECARILAHDEVMREHSNSRRRLQGVVKTPACQEEAARRYLDEVAV